MREHDTDAGRELEMLVDALDGVKASDELKSRTLDLLFAQLDAQEEIAANEDAEILDRGGRDGAHPARPHFQLIEGGGSGGSKPASSSVTQETSGAIEPIRDASAPVRHTTSGHHAGRRKARGRGWWVKVAAVVLAVSLTTGGVAYAVPVSQVTVNEGDTSIELGINVFGVAISASANTESGRELLEDASVRGANCEDAMARLLDAFALEESSDDIRVSVNGGPSDRRERFEEMAAQATEQRHEAARAAEGASAEPSSQGQVESLGQENAPSSVSDGQTDGPANQNATQNGIGDNSTAPDEWSGGGTSPEGNDETQPTGNSGPSAQQDDLAAGDGAGPSGGGLSGAEGPA